MRCTGYEMARYKGTQASHLYEKSMHTLCTIQWATAPGRSLNYPRPKSITHLRTFSDNGVYVALQLFLVILVSDQWRRVLIPYSYRQAPWGLLHAQGWLSWYTRDQQLYVVSEPRETHSPMLKARFLHLTNLVAQLGIEPPTSWLPGQRVTTRPRLILYYSNWRFFNAFKPFIKTLEDLQSISLHTIFQYKGNSTTAADHVTINIHWHPSNIDVNKPTWFGPYTMLQSNVDI